MRKLIDEFGYLLFADLFCNVADAVLASFVLQSNNGLLVVREFK